MKSVKQSIELLSQRPCSRVRRSRRLRLMMPDRMLADNGALRRVDVAGSATRNPAGSELSIAPDATLHYVGILSSAGFGAGGRTAVDNFADEIDDLIDELDRDDISFSEGNALVERFNAILGVPRSGRLRKVHGRRAGAAASHPLSHRPRRVHARRQHRRARAALAFWMRR